MYIYVYVNIHKYILICIYIYTNISHKGDRRERERERESTTERWGYRVAKTQNMHDIAGPLPRLERHINRVCRNTHTHMCMHA